jgi:cytochrome c-type biogenesis protein CcmE
MAELTWTKAEQPPVASGSSINRLKFIIGGVLLLAAVIYLIISATTSGAQYFITVEELVSNPAYIGQTVRISGAVDGNTIVYDSSNLIIDFSIANIPEEINDLAVTLHNAVNDPGAARLQVHIENQVKPDLLQHEAQAILTGRMGDDGIFYATELLLKCPSRYEEAAPSQVDHAEA